MFLSEKSQVGLKHLRLFFIAALEIVQIFWDSEKTFQTLRKLKYVKKQGI